MVKLCKRTKIVVDHRWFFLLLQEHRPPDRPCLWIQFRQEQEDRGRIQQEANLQFFTAAFYAVYCICWLYSEMWKSFGHQNMEEYSIESRSTMVYWHQAKRELAEPQKASLTESLVESGKNSSFLWLTDLTASWVTASLNIFELFSRHCGPADSAFQVQSEQKQQASQLNEQLRERQREESVTLWGLHF